MIEKIFFVEAQCCKLQSHSVNYVNEKSTFHIPLEFIESLRFFKKSSRLYFATWNVATKYPDGDPYEMFAIEENSSQNLPDFYILGYGHKNQQNKNIQPQLERLWIPFFFTVYKKSKLNRRIWWWIFFLKIRGPNVLGR